MRRRGLPEDRPARPRHALGGRGLRRPDRQPARRDDRPLADPARRSRGLRGDPAGGHRRRLPDREPRADAEPAPHAPGEPRRPDRPGRARPAGPDPGQGRPPVHRAPRSACARIPSFVPPVDHPLARRAAQGDARRRRLPGPGARGGDRARRLQRGGGRGAAAGDEPQAERGCDRGVPRALRRGRARQGRRRDAGRTRSTTSSSASRALASRSRTRRRSACSPTSRPGCGTTTRRSSSARC